MMSQFDSLITLEISITFLGAPPYRTTSYFSKGSRMRRLWVRSFDIRTVSLVGIVIGHCRWCCQLIEEVKTASGYFAECPSTADSHHNADDHEEKRADGGGDEGSCLPLVTRPVHMVDKI